jgi:hypothetical protein
MIVTEQSYILARLVIVNYIVFVATPSQLFVLTTTSLSAPDSAPHISPGLPRI